jgi:hypothetical protein
LRNPSGSSGRPLEANLVADHRDGELRHRNRHKSSSVDAEPTVRGSPSCKAEKQLYRLSCVAGDIDEVPFASG